jgi:hypothetical protein
MGAASAGVAVGAVVGKSLSGSSGRLARMTAEPLVRESVRPRAGRRFSPSHELRLQPAALHAASRLPGAREGVLLVTEMASPFGIPDFVALIGPGHSLFHRQALPVPPLVNELDAAIVATASSRAPRRATTLARELGWPVQTVVRRVPELVRSGALIETGSACYVRRPELVPLGRLYALETKVRDWRRALHQVRTYRLWADSYVVVLASLPQNAVELVRERVRQDGGGLVVADRTLERPRVHTLPKTRRLWAAEHLVAAIGPHGQKLSSRP